MSRYLSGRLGSSALASPAQSRAATPEKPQAQAPLLETPSWAAQAPAAVADDSSPPRVSTVDLTYHNTLYFQVTSAAGQWQGASHDALSGRRAPIQCMQNFHRIASCLWQWPRAYH